MPEFAPHLAPLRCTDPVEAVREHGSALRDTGADHFIVLSHATDDCDDRVARETDADVTLGGHTHVERAETVAGTLVVQPSGGGGHLIDVELGDGGATATAESTDTADATDTPRAVVRSVDDVPPVESLADALRARIAETGLDETVDRVETPIHRDRDACRVAESRVGNLVADAYRWAGEADVGLVPPGFLRTDEPMTGAVRRLDLLALAPHGGELVTTELSGARLRRVPRDLAAARTYEAFPADWLGHASGVEVRWSEEAEGPGELLSATVAGEAIRDDDTYRLATAEYTVVVDRVFPELDEDAVVDRSGPSYETVVNYGREHGVAPTIENRIRRE